MIRRVWGTIANRSTAQAGALSTIVLFAFCIFVFADANPVTAHQDRARTALSPAFEDSSTCETCKRALRPHRLALSRTCEDDSATLPLARGFEMARPRCIASAVPSGWSGDAVRATGVMLVGNVKLLN